MFSDRPSTKSSNANIEKKSSSSSVSSFSSLLVFLQLGLLFFCFHIHVALPLIIPFHTNRILHGRFMTNKNHHHCHQKHNGVTTCTFGGRSIGGGSNTFRPFDDTFCTILYTANDDQSVSTNFNSSATEEDEEEQEQVDDQQQNYQQHDDDDDDESWEEDVDSFDDDDEEEDDLSSPTTRGKKLRKVNYEYLAERDRREMEWLIKNTDRILGPNAPDAGMMDKEEQTITYELMRTWARRTNKKESRAPYVVEQLLKRLLEERGEDNSSALILDTTVYNTVLAAWSNSNEDGAAKRSEDILHEMIRMYENGNRMVKPDATSFEFVIKGYVKNGNRKTSIDKVFSIIRWMEEEYSEIHVTRRSYNLLLYALANSYRSDAPDLAEEILDTLIQTYEETRNELIKPDVNSFNQVLSAMAKSKRRGYEEKMLHTYHRLLDIADDVDTVPDVDTYNVLMGAWLKSGHPDSLSVIEDLFESMEESFKGGNVSARPDRTTLNTLFAATTKMSTVPIPKIFSRQKSLERYYNIRPDSVSVNIALDTWHNSDREDAPNRVLDLLDAVEDGYKRGNSRFKPSYQAYSAAIACFTKFRPNDPEAAEEILNRARDMYENHDGDPPGESIYNAVINAWASSDSLQKYQRVKDLLRSMEESDDDDPSIPKPSLITYNTVIKAAAADGNDESTLDAEKIVLQLEDIGKSSNPELLPDVTTYSSLITAFGRSNVPYKAVKCLEIINKMISRSKEEKERIQFDNNLNYNPPKREKNNNINTNKKKGKRRTVSSVGPNTYAFNAALNACAFIDTSNEKERAKTLEVAMELDRLCEKYSRRDSTTYGTLLRVCSFLLPYPSSTTKTRSSSENDDTNDPEEEEEMKLLTDEEEMTTTSAAGEGEGILSTASSTTKGGSNNRRGQLVEKIFNSAKYNGYVDGYVLMQLKFASISNLQHIKLTGRDMNESFSVQELPTSWSRNVHKKNKRKRRKGIQQKQQQQQQQQYRRNK